jgi:nuclear pore complex protein Nup62
MYACVCVCMYVFMCIYVCLYLRTYVFVCIYMYVYMYVCVYVCMYVLCVYAYVCMCVCMYICVSYVCMRMYLYMYVRMLVSTYWILFSTWKKWIGGTPLEHRHTVQISPHVISGLFQPWKWSSKARNFEVINGLQHVFEKWMKLWKKCIAWQGRYFEKETVTAPPQSSDSE